MNDRFYSAFLEGDFKALGVTLKPFSLWHQFLLEALQSPLMSGEAVDVHDLLLAIEVFKVEFPQQPRTKARLGDFWRIWRLKRNPKKLEELALTLAQYIHGNTSLPQFWKSEKVNLGCGSTSPETMQVITLLIDKGWSEKDAWDMSVGRAKWYEAVFYEKETPELRLFDESEVEEEEELKPMNDQELYKRAVIDLGQERADHWFNNVYKGGLN